MCTWRYRYPANLGTIKNKNRNGGTTIMQQWPSWCINNIGPAVTMVQQPMPSYLHISASNRALLLHSLLAILDINK